MAPSTYLALAGYDVEQIWRLSEQEPIFSVLPSFTTVSLTKDLEISLPSWLFCFELLESVTGRGGSPRLVI